MRNTPPANSTQSPSSSLASRRALYRRDNGTNGVIRGLPHAFCVEIDIPAPCLSPRERKTRSADLGAKIPSRRPRNSFQARRPREAKLSARRASMSLPRARSSYADILQEMPPVLGSTSKSSVVPPRNVPRRCLFSSKSSFPPPCGGVMWPCCVNEKAAR